MQDASLAAKNWAQNASLPLILRLGKDRFAIVSRNIKDAHD